MPEGCRSSGDSSATRIARLGFERSRADRAKHICRAGLGRLNWIDFSNAGAFDAAFASLEGALLSDIPWLRELTRDLGLTEH
jgi:hypothetical protein